MASGEVVTLVSTLLQAAGTVFQATAIGVTAYFASKSLNVWRRQLLGKRRIEVAEEVLVATYRVQSAINWIRNSGSFGNEGGSRPRGPSEPDEMTATRDAYFIPFERMRNQDGELAQFQKVKVLAQVYFGPAAVSPFEAVIKSVNQVAIAARMLISSVEQRRGPGWERMSAMVERWEREIWGADDDEITKRVEKAVAEIEELCRSQLKDDV